MQRPVTVKSVVGALNAGAPGAALDACRILLAAAPNDPPLNELAATAAYRTGQHQDAEAFAQRSLAGRPGHVATLILLGRSVRSLGRHADAAAVFGQAVERAPDLAEPAFLLCTTLLQNGDPKAGLMLDGLVSRFPQAAAGWEDLGEVLLGLGQKRAALVCLSRAAQAAPGFGLAMRIGLVHKDLGHPGDAAAAFTQAVGFDAGSVRGWFLLGLCSQDAGLPVEAAAAYRTALALDPALAEAAVNLGTLLQEGGDLDGAKAAYGQALRTRADTFGRIAQAMTTSPKGELWLDLEGLRRDLLAR